MRKARRAPDQQMPETQYPQFGYAPQQGGYANMEQPMMPAYGDQAFHQGPVNYYAAPPGVNQPQPPPAQQQQQQQLQQQHQFGGFGDPSQMMANPAMGMAMQFMPGLVNQGREVLDRQVNKYVAASRLKYYFSVDTPYVVRKLVRILFPFTHKDWSVRYNPEEPVQPRYEPNAPDLYIPAMAFLTYVLVGGLALGTQNKFAPEVIGVQASTAIGWTLLELVAVWLTLYVMNIGADLAVFDILAFTSYKYVGMILAIVASLIVPAAYHAVLLYVSIAVMFFLIRSLKVQILPESSEEAHTSRGSKRRTYLLLFIAVLQPLLMWILTKHLARPQT